ncbi:DUF6308 family protein [Streptomyces orinoci]|uniref:DUF6308 family protein n=1 Tax=Streptomyces orinoci TaxID=67339 RepID=A0ABV3K0W5_STRON|nr:DUF6308 family protein [Streptomyces orinoci]
MVDAEADVLAEGSPADQAWHLLCAQYGVDWVIAGKLLVRKRPRLLPVYDKAAWPADRTRRGCLPDPGAGGGWGTCDLGAVRAGVVARRPR